MPMDDVALAAAMAEHETDQLRAFVKDSNAIEGILRRPTDAEIKAHRDLLGAPSLTIELLEGFVAVVQPGAVLRVREGHRVFIADQRTGKVIYEPPKGGPRLRDHLRELLGSINCGRLTPAKAHVAYETLHPFSDGNGRSGRAVWAWHMDMVGRDPFGLAFLHRWYYDSLDLLRTHR